MKKASFLFITVTLLSACIGNSLPENVSKEIFNKWSSHGKSSPQDIGQMGTYYFNTKIIDSSKMEVSNQLKDSFVEAYCFTLETDIQTVRYRNDENKPLRHLKTSKIAYVKPTGSIYIGDAYANWESNGCSIPFVPRSYT